MSFYEDTSVFISGQCLLASGRFSPADKPHQHPPILWTFSGWCVRLLEEHSVWSSSFRAMVSRTTVVQQSYSGGITELVWFRMLS